MGREIRRVPKNWQHPRGDDHRFLPMYDQDYESESHEWISNLILWSKGQHPDQKEFKDTPKVYWEWCGPPQKDGYRPKFDGPATCYQIYETVSEGTPASPVFESTEAMIAWMISPIDRTSEYNTGEDWQSMQGMTKEQAERFCKAGSAPTGLFNTKTGFVAGHRMT